MHLFKHPHQWQLLHNHLFVVLNNFEQTLPANRARRLQLPFIQPRKDALLLENVPALEFRRFFVFFEVAQADRAAQLAALVK